MLKTEKYDKKSLPARLSWWAFFKAGFGSFRFIDINGRSCRKEWWVINVFAFILMFLMAFVYSAVAVFYLGFDYETASVEELNLFLNGANLINLICSLPMMAVGFRRFHDLGLSAWWGMLIFPNLLLPFVKGKTEDNRFGKNIY